MKTGRMVLEGLKELRLHKDPGRFDYSNYAAFVKDPFAKTKKSARH